ncbi:MAG: protoglobin domain-containing protein, partial [Methylococcales bacterium]
MSNSVTNHIIEIYLDHFRAIYKRSDKSLMEQIQHAVEDHAENISKTYFEVLLSTTEGKNVLNQKIIQSELAPGLATWIPSLFAIRDNDEDIIVYINQQLEIGKKNVRMNIPAHLCNLGNRVLKMEICNSVISNNFSAKQTRNIYTQVTMLVDTCLSISLESYIDDKISIEKHSHALQNHMLGSELAET